MCDVWYEMVLCFYTSVGDVVCSINANKFRLENEKLKQNKN